VNNFVGDKCNVVTGPEFNSAKRHAAHTN